VHVVRIVEMSTSRRNRVESELNSARPVRSILKAGNRHEATMASHPAGSKKKVRFELQEPDREGYDRTRRAASVTKHPNHHEQASTMRSAHDTQPQSDDESSVRETHRSETVHTMVPETVLRHKSNDATVSGRTVTRYDAALPEAIIDSAVE